MRTFFVLLCFMFFPANLYAQTCRPDSIPASTPDSQLVDNGNGTITDLKTGLMWKKCLEGFSGDSCETGLSSKFTWNEAMLQPSIVNSSGGFAGHVDWRLPNIRELISIVEGQCYYPAINRNRFPNTPSVDIWSGSPDAADSIGSASVNFGYGYTYIFDRNLKFAVRLVRGGQ